MIWIVSNIAAGTHSQIDALFARNNGDFVTMLVEAGQGDDLGVRKVGFWPGGLGRRGWGIKLL